ncbi:hypothetical protein FXV91_00310 [Methanosarcina sp. DH2]|uniref:hypothetical protein n=1 Tax=Methanosarcina sp. DH2 TaxID=2605639 RepID=UPI001E511ABF|nr:hypothetical protein [Methanosarcina sp. DH2]MCC4768690.1 hypothetical protein [Methanosarcina sp. DH2]
MIPKRNSGEEALGKSSGEKTLGKSSGEKALGKSSGGKELGKSSRRSLLFFSFIQSRNVFRKTLLDKAPKKQYMRTILSLLPKNLK